MKPRLALVAGSLLGLLALVVILAGADTSQAGTFNPELKVTIDNTEAGTSSDFTTEFNLPEGDVIFAGVVAFIPREWDIVPGDEIPIGTVVGELTAQATLGLINAACSNALPVHFLMLNASIDPTDTVPFIDKDDEGTEDYAEDRDESGLQDGFEKYPEFITRVLVDEDDQPLTPIRRAAGITIVAGVTVLLQFLVFEPGTFIDEVIPFDESLGYPSVTLLQNIGDPEVDVVPGPITDFCTPLTTTNITFGVSKDNPCTDVSDATLDPVCDVTSAPLQLREEDSSDPDEGGLALLVNPPEGTHTFTTISAGARDADGDGIENSLDTCPFAPNVGDPRINADGDDDTDGLDAACDPDDNNTNSDEDLDGFLNRGDNCPLDPNGELEDNQRDTDNDTIGDACDPNPENEDTEGDLLIAEVSQDVTIGPGTTPPDDNSADDDDDGGGSAVIIIIVVIAAVVVIGGGAFLFMRRGGSAA